LYVHCGKTICFTPNVPLNPTEIRIRYCKLAYSECSRRCIRPIVPSIFPIMMEGEEIADQPGLILRYFLPNFTCVYDRTSLMSKHNYLLRPFFNFFFSEYVLRCQESPSESWKQICPLHNERICCQPE